MVGEIEEWRVGPELLPLEEHRGAGEKQHQRRHRPRAARRGAVLEADPVAGIGDLIVVLDEDDEASRR